MGKQETPEEIQNQIITMVRDKEMSFGQTARELNMHKSTVKRICKRHGVKSTYPKFKVGNKIETTTLPEENKGFWQKLRELLGI